MRSFLIAILIFCTYYGFGQVKKCRCIDSTNGEYPPVNCKTTKLKSGGRLYWQYDCHNIWLTLENSKQKRFVIDSVPPSLGQYTYRLGYHLVKEYHNGLLFRGGCPANGPCNFVLIDKNNGKKLKEFGELIYDHSTGKFYDFILYFISPSKIGVYYVDSRKRFIIPVKAEDFNFLIPEYAFNEVNLKGHRLSLAYYDRNGKKRVVSIDLTKCS